MDGIGCSLNPFDQARQPCRNVNRGPGILWHYGRAFAYHCASNIGVISGEEKRSKSS